MKLLFDEELGDRREVSARQRAWESINLRIANNGATIDHALGVLAVLAGQVGVAQSQVGVPITQQPVTPIPGMAAATEVQQPAGAVYPPIRNVDQAGATATNVVQTALASVAAQIAALTDVVTKLADALVPVILTASGGASTPSQTTTKPAS